MAITTFCRHHTIYDGLRKTSDNPVAYGGFADVWEGKLKDEKVCVEVLRVYNMDTNNQKGYPVVCDIRKTLVHSITADIGQAFLRRSGCMEASLFTESGCLEVSLFTEKRLSGRD